jgi:hypothetical protein
LLSSFGGKKGSSADDFDPVPGLVVQSRHELL